jgi:hypothetical protein
MVQLADETMGAPEAAELNLSVHVESELASSRELRDIGQVSLAILVRCAVVCSDILSLTDTPRASHSPAQPIGGRCLDLS